jgi:hypothetical protein
MEHGANVASEDHVDSVMHGLAAVQRGMAFRDRLRNLKVTNVSTQIADQELWLDDGVHLVDDGYAIVARHITSGLEAMEARRSADFDQEVGGSKRARSGSCEATEPKRPAAWVTAAAALLTGRSTLEDGGEADLSEDASLGAGAGPVAVCTTAATSITDLSVQ